MNIFAHAPHWGRYFLQQSNIRKKMAKTIEMTQAPLVEKDEAPVEENVVTTETI
jgi:hypothetical protein